MRATTVLAAIIGALVGAFAATLAASDPDLFWHLASGTWMLDHGRILDRDVFSFTMMGTPYSAGQWLGEVIYAALYRASGWLAIDLLRGVLIGIAVFFIARVVLRFQPHPGWAILPIVAAILVSKLAWGDRPQLFSVALFPAYLDILLADRVGGSRRASLLVPLTLLWANLHGASVAGLGLMVVFAVEAWLTRAPQRSRLTLVLLLSIAASQLTPSGPSAFSFAASYAGSASLVVEERPADVTTAAGLVFAVLLIGALGLVLRADRTELLARTRSPLLWIGLVSPFTVLGLAHQRLLPYATMVLAPLVAALLPALLRRPVAIAPAVPRSLGALAIGAVALAGCAVALVAAPRSPDLASYPASALPALLDRPGNLLNAYDWGGFLIFAAPEHPTFIDGRGAALYPVRLIKEFDTAVGLKPGYRDVLTAHDISLVLIRPERALAVALREDGWSIVAEESGSWVLLQRK